MPSPSPLHGSWARVWHYEVCCIGAGRFHSNSHGSEDRDKDPSDAPLVVNSISPESEAPPHLADRPAASGTHAPRPCG